METTKINIDSVNSATALNPTFNLLKLTFGLVPIVAGLDKFTDILTRWENYIHPSADMLPFSPHIFMMIVGVIEIIAGVIVLIALTLIASGNYLDIAVRDLVMAIAAFSLAQIAKIVS